MNDREDVERVARALAALLIPASPPLCPAIVVGAPPPIGSLNLHFETRDASAQA